MHEHEEHRAWLQWRLHVG